MHRKDGLRTPPEFMITPTVIWADVNAPPSTVASLVEFAAAPAGGRIAMLVGDDRRARRLAAEALAHALGSALLRVDLSQVALKWLGETEANLDRVLAAADASGAVLLFDEADDLVGSPSTDKGLPTSYSPAGRAHFLKALDARRGVTLVAVANKSNIDPAFVRRTRLVAAFPRLPR